VRVEQFPCWLQDHVDAIFREIDQVTEDHNEALKRVLFQVKELLWVRLDQL